MVQVGWADKATAWEEGLYIHGTDYPLRVFASIRRSLLHTFFLAQLTCTWHAECNRCYSSSLCVKLVKRLEQEAVDWDAVASSWALERSFPTVPLQESSPAAALSRYTDKATHVDSSETVTEELRGESVLKRYLVWPRKHDVPVKIGERQRFVSVQFMLPVPEADHVAASLHADCGNKAIARNQNIPEKDTIAPFGQLLPDVDAPAPWCRLESDEEHAQVRAAPKRERERERESVCVCVCGLYLCL